MSAQNARKNKMHCPSQRNRMMNQEKKNIEALKNLEPNAMKKEANANIRNQSAVSVAALAFGMLLLVFVFIFSNIYIKKLERKILPMIDAGCHAAETADFSAAHSAGESIYQLLMDSEPTLKLLFSHRDILEIQLYAAAIADLGADGGRDEYIENFSAIKRWFSFFTETNDLSLEGIF